MTPVNLSAMQCSVARTLDVIGDKWSLLILRDAFYGVRRFDDFRLDLGVARNILTDRLNKLVDHDVLKRVPYEVKPPRYEYRLTEKGRDLLPVLLVMMRWGDKWASDGISEPTKLTHTKCGHDTEAVAVCSACNEELQLGHLMPHPIKVRVPEYAPAPLSESVEEAG